MRRYFNAIITVPENVSFVRVFNALRNLNLSVLDANEELRRIFVRGELLHLLSLYQSVLSRFRIGATVEIKFVCKLRRDMDDPVTELRNLGFKLQVSREGRVMAFKLLDDTVLFVELKRGSGTVHFKVGRGSLFVEGYRPSEIPSSLFYIPFRDQAELSNFLVKVSKLEREVEHLCVRGRGR